uniref:Uncharacterized protein n=1 Tax=Anguilla anguilla TaxID=7936 RepID=A0A0E9TXE1_ANGAN
MIALSKYKTICLLCCYKHVSVW